MDIQDIQRDQFQIIMFGDNEVVRKFSEYLGFAPLSNKGMVYFEFPNEKFTHKSFLKLFKYRLNIYILQLQILSTLMAPKRQFKDADAIIIFTDNSGDSLTKECFEYFEKFALARKSFIPILLVGYNFTKTTKPDLKSFFFNLEVAKFYHDIFGIETFNLEITENENEPLFFLRVQQLLEISRNSIPKEFSTIAVESMMQNLKNKILELKHKPVTLERGISLLAEFEFLQDKNIKITRYSLENKWGLSNKDAKAIMNFWEKRIVLQDQKESERILLENDSNLKLEKCRQLKLEPNLVTFLVLGYDFYESKKGLALLKEMDKIEHISYHIPPEEYDVYENFQDMIILANGKQIYSHTSDNDSTRITMFSGLIQAIEVLRDKYTPVVEGDKNYWLQINKVDFLEFGNLHCVLGSGKKGVKVVLRFKDRPQGIYIEKTQAFIKQFEEKFEDIINKHVLNLQEIESDVDTLFYEYYNPFPQKISLNKILLVSAEQAEKKMEQLTDTEKEVIDVINFNKGLTIREILKTIEEKSNYSISESDVLPIVFDLVAEKILK